MHESITVVLDAALSPVMFPFDPSRRVFWLFLLSSFLLALFLLYGYNKHLSLRKLKKVFLNPAYWLHRSSLQDMRYLFMNSILKVLIVIPLVGTHIAATIWVSRFLQSNFGDAPVIALSTTAICVLYTLTFFVIEDYSRYGLHRLMHEWQFLWRFHKVHHSASVLTPLTLYRAHPIEMLLYYIRGIVMFGGISGVFVYFFQGRLDGYDILGVDLLGFLFNLFGANLRHSHIWLSFGWFERFFISPAQHQIHHSSAVEHQDKNYGTCLAIWDRVGRSWVSARRRQKIRFGLHKSHSLS